MAQKLMQKHSTFGISSRVSPVGCGGSSMAVATVTTTRVIRIRLSIHQASGVPERAGPVGAPNCNLSVPRQRDCRKKAETGVQSMGPRGPSLEQAQGTWGLRSRRRPTSPSLTWQLRHLLSRRTTTGYRCRHRTRSTRETIRRRLHHREVAVKEWERRGGGMMTEVNSQALRTTMLRCCHRRSMEEEGRVITIKRSTQRSGGIGRETLV